MTGDPAVTVRETVSEATGTRRVGDMVAIGTGTEIESQIEDENGVVGMAVNAKEIETGENHRSATRTMMDSLHPRLD